MLHVVLLILKILGWILAAILGIVLVIVLLVLFVPIRYKAYVKKQEDFLVKAKATWLFPILSVPILYQNGEPEIKIKVFGIPVKGLMAEEPQNDNSVRAAQGQIQRKRKFSILEKIKNLKYTIRHFCDKIKQLFQKLREMMKKIQETKTFVTDERTLGALKLAWGQVRKLVKGILPRKVKGEVHFGTEDPALTGEILGGISIFYPIFMDNVRVIPDFEESVLEGELRIKGRLRVVTLVCIAWKLFWDKNIRYVYQKLMK